MSKPLPEAVLYQIEQANKKARRYSQRRMDEAGMDINVDQWVLLKIISESDGLSQSDLANKSLRDAASITSSLDALEKKQLIRRIRLPENRRQHKLVFEKKRAMKNVIIFIVGLLTPALGFCQLDSLELDSLKNLYIDSIYEDEGMVEFKNGLLSEGQAYTKFKQLFTGYEHDSFYLIDNWTDSILGYEHNKYELRHRGIPVEACISIEHMDSNGYVDYITGFYTQLDVDTLMLSIIPKSSALQNALDEIDPEIGETFAWQDTAVENELKRFVDDTTATYYPLSSGKIIFAIDDTFEDVSHDMDTSHFKLSWVFDIKVIAPNLEYYNVFVNALSGNVYRIDNRLRNGLAAIYGGNAATIPTSQSGTEYVLEVHNNYRSIETYESNPTNHGDWQDAFDVTDDNDNWQSDVMLYTTPHHYIDKTIQYFNQVHHWSGFYDNGPDNVKLVANSTFNGISSHINTHNGTTLWEVIEIGYLPHHQSSNLEYTGYDMGVLAHEYFHSILTTRAKIVARKESGAIGEHICDVLGVSASRDFFTTDNWIWGDNHVTSIRNVRSLEDPESYGTHIVDANNDGVAEIETGQPFIYEGDKWWSGTQKIDYMDQDDGGIHINNGPANHWFYLVANGGSDTYDGRSFNIWGIGEEEAAELVFYVSINMLGTYSKYKSYRRKTIKAAEKLWGQCSNEVIAVENAWYAIGLGDESKCAPNSKPDLMIPTVDVFPNPAENIVNVTVNYSDNFTLSLWSMDGRLIKDYQSNGQRQIISTADLKNGVYFLKVNTANGQRTKKIVISKQAD